MKNKIILEIGAEGGGLKVYKTKEHYFFTTDERTQVDLLDPEHPPTKELYNTSDFYNSFDQVMFHLHKNMITYLICMLLTLPKSTYHKLERSIYYGWL